MSIANGSSVTAQMVLDLAQSRHPLFSNQLSPYGALLKTLDAIQRTLLLRYGGAIDGLVDTTVQLSVTGSGLLVGNDNGTPFMGTLDGSNGWPEHDSGGVPFVDFSEVPLVFGTGVTYPDGWSVHMSAMGNPYVNFAEAPIAFDPFGKSGGTPGFPLPGDYIKLIFCNAVLGDQTFQEINVVPQRQRLNRLRQGLNAFISGNRLIPIRPMASGNSGDFWSINISYLQLAYVAWPILSNLSDIIGLPAVLHEALIARLAEFMAMSTPGLNAQQRLLFSQNARAAEASAEDFSVDVTGATTPHSVRYRR